MPLRSEQESMLCQKFKIALNQQHETWQNGQFQVQATSGNYP